jgi:putative NADPH-quinone reductase
MILAASRLIHSEENNMKVLTVYVNPNPQSFCHPILEQFSKGLRDVLKQQR